MNALYHDRLAASPICKSQLRGSSTIERQFFNCTSYHNASTMQLKSLNYTLLSQSEVESPDEFRSRKRSNLVRRGLIWGIIGLLGLGILIGIVVGLSRS